MQIDCKLIEANYTCRIFFLEDDLIARFVGVILETSGWSDHILVNPFETKYPLPWRWGGGGDFTAPPTPPPPFTVSTPPPGGLTPGSGPSLVSRDLPASWSTDARAASLSQSVRWLFSTSMVPKRGHSNKSEGGGA